MSKQHAKQLDEFFAKAWKRYTQITPEASLVEKWMTERGESPVNDHVAFRTFNLPKIGRFDLGRVFEAWGYKKAGEDLEFPEKKLLANYFLHPDPTRPKIFISELLLEKCSPELQSWIKKACAFKKPAFQAEDFFTPSWNPVEFSDYQKFYPESEYAAWTAAFGIQVNHFTVFVNSLSTFGSLQELNDFLTSRGLTLNSAGGVIKGNPSEYLEQSSTLASRVPCAFAGGHSEKIMGCYYEFARRYTMPNGELFLGFIPKSADKIFESTFERKK